MKNLNISQPAVRGLLHAAGAVIYIVAILSFLLFSKFFDSPDFPEFFGPILLLSLLVISVATMGGLFFLKPLMLFVEGQKKEAVLFLTFTMGWFVF